MTLTYPSLLAIAAPLLAATLAVHWFNLRRERRVAWGAMELLLASHRRRRVWIELRTSLLLALRLAAVCLAALALARPNLADLFGGVSQRRVVLLDDSFSMTDRSGESSPWDLAGATLRGSRPSDAASPQTTIVLLASELLAVAAEGEGPQLPLQGPRPLPESARPCEAATPLGPAIERLRLLLSGSPLEDPVALDVVSDFRRGPAGDSQELVDQLRRIAPMVERVRLLRCGSSGTQNLALAGLTPGPGALAAGTEVPLKITLLNQGDAAAAEVRVRLYCDGQPLPAVELGEAPPHAIRSVSASVWIDRPGDHVVTAELEADAVATDNLRYLPLRLPESRTVLVVGAEEDAADTRSLRAAIAPGGTVRTGWRSLCIGPDRLAERVSEGGFDAVVLVDVPSLSGQASAALGGWVRDGGGLLVLLGPRANRQFYNEQLFAAAESPLMMLELGAPTQTPPGKSPGTADLSATPHPLTRSMTGGLSALASGVTINYLHRSQTSEVQTLASLWDGSPLFCAARSGRGRVACLLTHPSAEVGWSTLSASPVFPIWVQDCLGYLSQPRLRPDLRTLGFRRGQTPAESIDRRGDVLVGRSTSSEPTESSLLGVYLPQSNPNSTRPQHPYALNAEPEEGDLTPLDSATWEELRAIEGVSVGSIDRLSSSVAGESPADATQGLVTLIAGLLALESLSAWSGFRRRASATAGAA